MTINEDKIWQQYYLKLKAFIISQVSDNELAEDILHDVYIKVNAKLTTLSNPDSISAWLYQITRHVIIDHYRKNKGELFSEFNEELHIKDEQLKSDLVKRELSKCLLPMINKLPDKYRQSIYLSEIEGYTQKKVAELMGQTLSATKTTIQRGRKKIRQSLGKCCRIELDGKNRISDFDRKCDSDKYCPGDSD